MPKYGSTVSCKSIESRRGRKVSGGTRTACMVATTLQDDL